MASTINASTTTGIVQSADTSGQLELQSNGTTKLTVSSTGTYGQITSGTVVASTSGTSIDFTSIPSWVKRITVMFNGVSTNGSSIIQVQLGTSGGVQTTSYDSAGFTNGAVATSTTGLLAFWHGGASTLLSGMMIISLVDSTSNTWVASCNTSYGGGTDSGSSSGKKVTTTTLDRVRITTVNGTDTFDAGSINILYEG
jgi:predicted small secreted protein